MRNDSRAKSDNGIIEQDSDELTALILKHRRYIAQCFNISDRLSDFLKNEDITIENCIAWGQSLNYGIDALGKAINLERQVFKMDDK